MAPTPLAGLARPSSHAAPSSVGAHHRRARSHIPLPASPNRNVYKATAAAAESEIRARLRALPFTRGAELASLAEDLERAYTKALCLTHENHGEDVVRVARRRLRLIERPAPPAAGRLSAYSAGVSTCAAAAVAVMWSRPATHSRSMPAVSRVFRRVRAGVSADSDTDRVAVVLGRGDARVRRALY